jgi:hypothetical protein
LAVRGSAAASMASTLTSLAKPLTNTGTNMSEWPAGTALDSSASQLHCSSVLRDSASSASLTALAQKMKGVGLSQATAASSTGWGSGAAPAGHDPAAGGTSCKGVNSGSGTTSAVTASRGPSIGGLKGAEAGNATGHKAATKDADGATLQASQGVVERRGVGPLASGMSAGGGGKGHERPATAQGGRDTGGGVAADRSGPKAHMIASMVGLPGK